MLHRGIRKWDLVLLVINSIIGAGIFGLPSKVFRLSGSYSLLAFVACAIVAGVFIFVFAEVSSRFDKTGGPYVYVHETFGPFAAFLVAWLLIIGRVFNYATLINLLVVYFSFFSNAFADPAGRVATIIFLTAFLTFINYIGVKDSTRFNNMITIAKLLPLAVFIIVGLFFLQPQRFSFSTVPALSSFTGSVLLLVFAFGGFESALINAGEMINPQKNLPFALIVAASVVAIFYCLIQFVCIGVLPTLASSEKPLADAAGLMMGKAGGLLITIGAGISITGTLNSIMLSASRMPFALSEQNQFPKFFAHVHPRYRTPVWSLLFFAVIVSAVSMAWSFMSALNVAVIIRLVMYSSVCAALIKLRKKNEVKNYFKLRYGILLAVAGVILTICLLTSSKWKEILDFLIWLGAGLLLFVVIHSFKKKKMND